jgi:hypothetical protein
LNRLKKTSSNTWGGTASSTSMAGRKTTADFTASWIK